MWALSFLGLDQQADERAIKRAYAKLLKQTRPDEDPKGFQKLNEAYQAAVQWRREHPLTESTSSNAITTTNTEASDLPLATITTDQAATAVAETTSQLIVEQTKLANPNLNHYYKALMQLASTGDAKQLNAWLQTNTVTPLQPPLLANYLLEHWQTYHPALAKECFDVLNNFFQLTALAEQMAINLDSLRSSLNNIWNAKQQANNNPALINHQPQQQAPAVNSHVDSHSFYQKCLTIAQQNNIEQLNLWLQTQQDYWSLESKQQVGQRLLDNLQQNPEPLSKESFTVILDFFNLNDILANTDITAIQALQNQLNSLWLFNEKHTATLKAQDKSPRQIFLNFSPKQPYADWPMLEQMNKPFSWLQAIRASFPVSRATSWSHNLRTILGETSGKVPSNIDNRQINYWLSFSKKGFLQIPKLILATITLLIVAWVVTPIAMTFIVLKDFGKINEYTLDISVSVVIYLLVILHVIILFLWYCYWTKIPYSQINNIPIRIVSISWIPALALTWFFIPTVGKWPLLLFILFTAIFRYFGKIPRELYNPFLLPSGIIKTIKAFISYANNNTETPVKLVLPLILISTFLMNIQNFTKQDIPSFLLATALLLWFLDCRTQYKLINANSAESN